MRKKLLCLDSNSIFNRAFYGIRLLSAKDGTYTNAVYGFLNILQKLLNLFQPDYVCCAFDLKAPTFRHALYGGYKAGRKGMPDELAMQLPILKELLNCLGYRICELAGYEADDILGTMSAAAVRGDADCIIATGDRDSLQLIREGVTVCLAAPKNNATEIVMCDEEYVRSKYGLAPGQLIDVKALMGDASDNIPGVKGIGEKGALELVKRFGALDNIYENIDDPSITASMRQKLALGKEMAYLSLKLGTIDCGAPVGSRIEDYSVGDIDHARAYEMLTRLEMFSTIEKLGIRALKPAATPEAREPAAPPLKVCRNVAAGEFMAALNKRGEADFLMDFDSISVTAMAVIFGQALYLFDSGTSGLKELAAKFLSSDCGKRTFGSKKLHRFSIENDIPIKNLSFDAELAAYLLSPNSSKYAIETLAAEYSASAPTADCVGEDFPGNLAQLALLLKPLADKLRLKIESNMQGTLLYDIEMPLARVLASMELTGLAVDADALRGFGAWLGTELERLTADIYEDAGGVFNINSPKQLGEVLFGRLNLPAKKKNKSGYSTDAEVLDSLKKEHPIVEKILEYRTLAKLKSTYVDGLLKAVAPDGRIHTSFVQTETRTGRISSVEPNMQNIPVRTEIGSRLRKFFKAKPGCVLADADYSQIELRVLAHIAGDANMIRAFLDDEDIHTNTAAQVFNLPAPFVTPLMRSRAKAVNFGIVYGIGAYSLSQDIGVSMTEASEYINSYLNTYSGVKKYMSDTVERAKKDGYVTTMFGRRRYLPELNASNKTVAANAARIAMNTPIQGTAADIIKIAMIRVYNRFSAENLRARLILQVHDELIAEAPEDEAAAVCAILKEEMEKAAAMSVPLRADVGTGTSWHAAKHGG